MVTATVFSAETAAADVTAATAVSGSSYYCSAAADAAATASANPGPDGRLSASPDRMGLLGNR